MDYLIAAVISVALTVYLVYAPAAPGAFLTGGRL